jgi:hypothetical protein
MTSPLGQHARSLRLFAGDGLILKIHPDYLLSFIEHRFSEIPDREAVENMMSIVIEYPQVV